jgi:hypothetical protein
MKTELLLKLIEMLVEKPSIAEKQPTAEIPPRQYIVVLDRGFVYVGNVVVDSEWVHISDAKNIRQWGTKNGLGELRNGPLEETILDECGTVLAPKKALISLIPCSGF